MRSTFRIHFFVNRSKSRNGVVPIMGRITINGTKAQFSCKCSIPNNLWGTHENRAIGKGKCSDEINLHLDTLRGEIIKSYHKLFYMNPVVTARMVKEELFKTGNEYKTILEYVQNEIETFALRVNKDRSKQTHNKMKAVHNHLRQYIVYKYNNKNIYLQEIKEEFIRGFWEYLIYNIGLAHSTVWVYCTYIKKIMIAAHNQGYVNRNPFKTFKISPNVKPRGFITEEELKKMLQYRHPNPQYNNILNIFLFSCFTGISFADTFALKWKNIQIINGQMWVFSSRQKSRMPFQVLLIQRAKDALYKACSIYANGEAGETFIFRKVNNTQANRVLKKIALECGIEKNLTWHLARHTFATLALSKGMSIESVSKILGHSNITTTQIYAKIVNTKIANEFKIMEQELEI